MYEVTTQSQESRLPMPRFHLQTQHLPQRVNLKPLMTSVKNQGDTYSCTANAIATATEYILLSRSNREIQVSRLFIYYNGRMIERKSLEVPDKGVRIYSTLSSLRKFGVCEEFLWPFEIENIEKKPPSYVYEAAHEISIVSWKIPQDVNAMRACLAAKRPIIISMILVPDADTEAKRNNGYITKPNISSYAFQETIDNFHTVLIVGYDDETKHFHVQNSYGRDWGHDGYFHIPYKYVLDQNLVPTGNDIWAIGDVVSRAEQSPPMWQLVTP